GRARVGVMGLSFAGGLSLMLAASHPEHVAFAVSVGGHHDLPRVLRFLVTNEIEAPEGRLRRPAHDYGLLVFAQGHSERLFPTDAARARQVLRRWLQGDPEGARRDAQALEPAARATMERLVRHDQAALAPRVEAILADEAERGLAASPRGKLGALTRPVFLLHGAEDDVVPASEARWIWSELPSRARGALLVSPSLGHVELKGAPRIADEAALVEFMSGVLRAAWDEPRATRR
ncbi:MAG: alpha/beta hydrolase, partial [Polyangiaceae bacterium]|nr:alpha/beta hydrolase [Polyangiaceae bacterium]